MNSRRWLVSGTIVSVALALTVLRAAAQESATPTMSVMGDAVVQTLPPLVEVVEPDTPQKDYQNLQVLNHLRGAQIERVMGFFAETMGQKCAFCHNIRDYASDEKEHKRAARDMIRLVQHLNTEWFQPLRITCYTCHDATADVPLLPEDFASIPDLVRDEKPRRLPDEFVNVQRLQHLTEEEYNTVMDFFVASLGQRNCRFCHNIRDYPSDEKEEKVRARQMITMVQDINPRGWSEKPVTCYACHRGSEHPRRFPKGWRAEEVEGIETSPRGERHHEDGEEEEHGESGDQD